MKAQSLHTSIPALHLWVKLLNSEHYSQSKTAAGFSGSLLEVCSQRMLRYESLPHDSTKISTQCQSGMLFLANILGSAIRS